jgi:DNA-binding winged helix-turn-helix (wHTH) protein
LAFPAELHFGSCAVHAQRHEVLRDGQVQDIPPKAFELLLLLLRERHRAVAKGDLVGALWRQQAVSESVLARTLMKVRQAIGDSATQPVWIKTIHGYGYRFVGEVTEARAPEPGPAARRHGGTAKHARPSGAPHVAHVADRADPVATTCQEFPHEGEDSPERQNRHELRMTCK